MQYRQCVTSDLIFCATSHPWVLSLHPCPVMVMLGPKPLCDLQAMLFSALCSAENVVAPYPTARQMGEQPLSKEQFSQLRRQTLRQSTQATATRHISPEVSSKFSGPQNSSRVFKFDLELAMKLSKTVFYGR